MKKGLLIFTCLLSQIILANEVNPQCYSYLTELVRTSNFPFKEIPREANNLLIDTDDNNIILAQINYDKKVLNIPYDTNRTAINGWVKYDMLSQKLYNVSADIDPDNPIGLSFEKKYANLFKNCREGIVIDNTSTNCVEINNESLIAQTLYSPKKELKITQAGRTYFYSAPNDNCKVSNNLFIIKNDQLIVLGEFEEFYNVIYQKKNGDKVAGWINKNSVASPQKNGVTILFDEYKGDSLVSKKDIVKSIDELCTTKNFYNRTTAQTEEDNKRCALSKINFPYDKFLNLGNVYSNESKLSQGEKVYIWQSRNFDIYIKETKKSLANGNYYVEITLFTEKDNKVIDHLIVYKEEHDVDAFAVKHQYYFISTSLILSILDVSTTEEGTLVNFWKNYKIDNNGKIILMESMTKFET